MSFQGSRIGRFNGLSRRAFLRAGMLGMGGLTLADVLRLQARAESAAASRHTAVIMVYLNGGPSHLDTYDLKPAAAAEFRGEFKPIRTNVPGIEICELLPLQARLADKMAIVRGLKFVGNHSSEELMTAEEKKGERQSKPAFGSMVSYLRRHQSGAMPPYVSLMRGSYIAGEKPVWLGLAHQPFSPNGPDMENLGLHRDTTLARLADYRSLMRSFDQVRDDAGRWAGTDRVDAFTHQALDILSSGKVRDAFDIDKEPAAVRARYGQVTQFLQARRLVEAGVSVVTVNYSNATGKGDWDTHDKNFEFLKSALPPFDQGLSALISDLSERGLDERVAVVVWGEFGRTPRINDKAGRDHWTDAGFVLLSGGGLRMGQVIGKTNPQGERLSEGTPYGVPNVLATLYHVLGIAPHTTIEDNSGRPQYLLPNNAEPINELI